MVQVRVYSMTGPVMTGGDQLNDRLVCATSVTSNIAGGAAVALSR